MAELRNRHSEVDFSSLKKDSGEFHRVSEIVKGSEGKGAQTKNTMNLMARRAKQQTSHIMTS